MPNNVTETILNDPGIGKMTSLIKWVSALMLAFAMLLSGLTYNLGLIIGDLETKIGVLGAQTNSFQESTNIRLDRLERQFDSL